jgi:hypothetical protein
MLVFVTVLIMVVSCEEPHTSGWTTRVKQRDAKEAMEYRRRLQEAKQTYHLDAETIKRIPMPQRVEFVPSTDSSSHKTQTRKSAASNKASLAPQGYDTYYKKVVESTESRDWIIAQRRTTLEASAVSSSSLLSTMSSQEGSASNDPQRRTRLPVGVNRPQHVACPNFQGDTRIVKIVLTDLTVGPSTVNERGTLVVRKRSRMKITVKAELKTGLVVKGRLVSTLFKVINGFEDEVDTRNYSLCEKLTKSSCPLKMDKIEFEIEEQIPSLLQSGNYLLKTRLYANDQEAAVACTQFELVISV